LGLGERASKSGILDAQLVDECAAFFPAAVGLVCGGQGGIEERGARLERLDVLVPALAEGALGLAILLGALTGGEWAGGAA